jgi:pimeloyl-ACP methyl ester carboxylesterase
MARLASIRVDGGARATVLLHGFLGSSKNLRGFAQRWAERDPERSFLLVDLTGHGASPPLPAGADLAVLADDVAETVAAAGLAAPVSVLGHSLGGRVALAWADAAPESLADIVLLDIAPGPIELARSSSRRVLDVLLAAPAEAPDRRAFRALLTGAGLEPPVADWVLMNLECDARSCRWRIDRAALDALHERVNGADLWPVVEARQVPVRCIRGARSGYVTDADAARLRAAHSPVDTVEGAGHDLHVEAPSAVIDLIVRG